MVYFAIALFFFIVASFTDIKKHEVPPVITYSLLVIGLALHFIDSIISVNAAPIAWSSLMALSCFALSYALYRLGVWAGGDVKLFTALGAILPYYKGIMFFPFFALAASLIAVFPAMIAYVVYCAFKNPKVAAALKKSLRKALGEAAVAPFVITGAYHVASLAGFPLLVLAVAPLLYFLKKPGLIASALLTIAYLLTSEASADYFIGVFGISVAFFCFIAAYSASKKHALRETKKASELREGDILAKDFVRFRGKLSFAEHSWVPRKGAAIVLSSLNAGGLEKRDISLIKRLGVRTVELKKSVPFVPIFTLGLVVVFALEMLLY
jgi:preflagellin peptidase FlaK